MNTSQLVSQCLQIMILDGEKGIDASIIQCRIRCLPARTLCRESGLLLAQLSLALRQIGLLLCQLLMLVVEFLQCLARRVLRIASIGRVLLDPC